ncbi:uncharacterized protein LOC130749774 [Lotus japonicus]|uniref:uncharacterized protein LOC130749774 n=1 Tax=Lotus japonicus TaxID=34305 RepID=UPI0025908A2D|nr:uncharacterized protein LOC130749774 [Lotus japonicus]
MGHVPIIQSLTGGDPDERPNFVVGVNRQAMAFDPYSGEAFRAFPYFKTLSNFYLPHVAAPRDVLVTSISLFLRNRHFTFHNRPIVRSNSPLHATHLPKTTMTSNLPHASNTRHPSSFSPSPIKTLLPHCHPFPRPLFTSLIAYQTPSAHFRSGAVAYHPFRYPLFTSYSGESHCPYLYIAHILIFSFLSLHCLLKMASNPTSPNHSSSSSESDPDSTAAGGLRLEVPEIPAHRLQTYATLPLPVQVAPKHEAIDQPSIFQDSDPIVQFVNSLGGLSNDDEFNAKLRIWVCSPGDRPWLHKPDGDVKRSHFFFAYEYMFIHWTI